MNNFDPARDMFGFFDQKTESKIFSIGGTGLIIWAIIALIKKGNYLFALGTAIAWIAIVLVMNSITKDL